MTGINKIILALAKGHRIRKTYWPKEDFIVIEDYKIIGSWGGEHFLAMGDFDDEWVICDAIKLRT